MLPLPFRLWESRLRIVSRSLHATPILGLGWRVFITSVPARPQRTSKLDGGYGSHPPLHFSVGSFKGDWQSWTINFADHFISPPVVILTADNYDGSLLSYSVAAVPMANDVTSFGFTLAARNADVAAGWVSFSWLAIGHRA